MAQIKINGSGSADTISTYDLNEQYPSNTGFSIQAFGGDDDITLSFVGRSGVDSVNAGIGEEELPTQVS